MTTVIENWIAELRSGRWPQGKRRLATVDGGETRFCCLGVLCELAVEAGVVQEVDLIDSGLDTKYRGYDGNTIDTPTHVRWWAGFDEMISGEAYDAVRVAWSCSGTEVESAPASKFERATRRIWVGTLNDEGWPFAAIADAIEYDLVRRPDR